MQTRPRLPMSVSWHTVQGMSCSDAYPAERLAVPDVAWPSRYTEVSAGLLKALGSGWTVEHVGSTSVPGLVAKPVIDLALRLPQDCLVAETSSSLVCGRVGLRPWWSAITGGRFC